MKKAITFIIAMTAISPNTTNTPKIQYIDSFEEFVIQAEIVWDEDERFDDNDSANLDFLNAHFDIIHPK
tara:strand:- start:501 stop:707 length:207 start_codon:yes stop_codon:yes gene_type:complete